MNGGLYKVNGPREYRGHAPGTTFVARIPLGAEARAIARGDITRLERTTPSIHADRLTRGWLNQQEEVQ